MDKRQHPRFRARFDVLYSSGRMEGAGVLTDISYSGARLEETSIQPTVGTRVRLYVFVQPIAPFELIGHEVELVDPSPEMPLDQAGVLEHSKVPIQCLFGDFEIAAEIGRYCPTSTETNNDVAAGPIGKRIKDPI